MRLIYTSENKYYRIIENHHLDYLIDDLLGDSYDSEVNTDIDPKKLEIEKNAYLKFIEDQGVFGYKLEIWNPEPDQGWEYVNSCWGFVGQYDPTTPIFDHYIIEEMKNKIKKLSNKKVKP